MYFLPIVFVVGCLELLFVGYRESSLRYLLQFDASARWDLISTAIYLIGVDVILLNLYLFGFFDQMMATARLNAGFLFLIKTSILANLVVYLIYDFLSYWRHRLGHHFDWLWISHKFHHSATEMNVLVTARSHPLQGILREKTIITFFFGYLVFNNIFFITHMFVNVMSHSRLQGNLGFFGRYIFISPDYHHLHHDIRYQNKNFSNGLIIWDRLFGTYQAPDSVPRNKMYGVGDANYPLQNPLTVYVMPFIDFTLHPLRTIKDRLKNRRQRSAPL